MDKHSAILVTGAGGFVGKNLCAALRCRGYDSLLTFDIDTPKEALREYVHVDDASAATLAVLDPEFENQNIIISGNQPMRVGDLFKMIGEMLGKELNINYMNDPNSGHYQVTPYAFMPKVGRKLVPPLTVDLGQGILRVMEEEHKELHPELASEGGYLVSTDD